MYVYMYVCIFHYEPLKKNSNKHEKESKKNQYFFFLFVPFLLLSQFW